MNKKAKLFYGYDFPMTTYWENYRKGGFTQLSLDFSSRCNYKCDWCFNKHLLNRAEPDILSFDERVKLMENAVKLGVKTLVVPGTGEPTLDPYFMETIEKAHDLGLITVIYSNLTGQVDKKTLKFLFANNVSIGVKMDTFVSGLFVKRYHTVVKKFDEYLKNLDMCIKFYKGSQQASTVENHCAIFSFGLTVKSNGDVQLCPDHHSSRGMFNIRKTPLCEIIGKINSQRKIESDYCVIFDDY